MRALALAVLFAASAGAQPRCSEAGVLAGALVTGAVAGAVAGRVAYAADGVSARTVLTAEAAYALGVAAAVPLAGAAFGCDGDALRGVGGALLAGDRDLDTAVGSVLLGGALAAVLPPVLGVTGYDARPAAFVAPTGERGVGLSLRVGL